MLLSYGEDRKDRVLIKYNQVKNDKKYLRASLLTPRTSSNYYYVRT